MSKANEFPLGFDDNWETLSEREVYRVENMLGDYY